MTLELADIAPNGAALRRFARWSAIEPDAKRAIDNLVAARLCISSGNQSGEKTVAIAHEALFRCWPPLREALTEERERMLMLARVEQDAATWRQNGSASSWLTHHGRRLSDALRLLRQAPYRSRASETAHRFLAACRKRVLRGRLVSASAGIVLLSLVGAGGWFFRQVAVQSQMIDAAEAALLRDDHRTAAELALSAAKLIPFGPLDEALSDLLTRSSASFLVAELSAPDESFNSVAFFPTSEIVVGATSSGQALIWSIENDARLATLKLSQLPLWSVAVNHDGVIAAGGSDGRLRLVQWPFETSSAEVIASRRTVGVVAFGDDGTEVLAGSHDGRARIWQLDEARSGTASAIELSGHGGDVGCVATLDQGNIVVTGSSDYSIRAFRRNAAGEILADSGDVVAHFGEPVTTCSASEGGIVLAVGDARGNVHAVNVKTRSTTSIGERSWGSVTIVTMTPAGDAVAAAYSDGTTRLFKVRDLNLELRATLRFGANSAESVASSADGKYLATATVDGRILVWNAVAIGEPSSLHATVSFICSNSFGLSLATWRSTLLDGRLARDDDMFICDQPQIPEQG